MNGDAQGSPVLLAEVFACDYRPDQSATYVRVYNPGPQPVNLAGYALEWDGIALAFPTGPILSSGDSAYIAWNAGAFQHDVTQLPDYTIQPFRGIASLVATDAPHPFNPGGGTVRILAPGGAALDALVWGNATAPAEWTGSAVPSDQPGTVFRRAIDESTLAPDSPGRFKADPASAAAWHQGTDWISRRIMHLGQGAQTYPSFQVQSVLLFVCPDSSFVTIAGFIDAAQTKLDINLYLFTQEALAPRIEAALQRKVAVRLLLEGGPVVGLPPGEYELVARLQAAGAKVQCMKRTASGFERYHFDHAKYGVADGQRCLVMSDNWTHGSVPVEAVTGQRGWGAIFDSTPMAEHLTQVFDFDWNPASPDSVGLDQVSPSPPNDYEAQRIPPRPIADPTQSLRIDGPVTVTPILAPEHALLESLGVPGLMRSATKTLDVEQPTIPLYWTGPGADSPETTPNLFLSELVAAARRGVQVRVVLGGAYLDPQDPRDNTRTRYWLRTMAKAESLPIEVRILDYAATGMGIHNKGLIVDGRMVLISSINWTENSPLYNRELGLIIESEAVAAYYGSLFGQDWDNGE